VEYLSDHSRRPGPVSGTPPGGRPPGRPGGPFSRIALGCGVSNFDARQLAAALAAGTPQAIQNSYSLLARQDEPDLLPLCAQRDVAYLAFSPLAGGWLTGKYRRGEPFPAGSRMTQRPEPYRGFVTGRTFDALAWLLADERVTQVVIGPGRPEHLAPVAEARQHPLTAPERAEIGSVIP